MDREASERVVAKAEQVHIWNRREAHKNGEFLEMKPLAEIVNNVMPALEAKVLTNVAHVLATIKKETRLDTFVIEGSWASLMITLGLHDLDLVEFTILIV